MSKRIFALLLVLALLLCGCSPAGESNQEKSCVDHYDNNSNGLCDWCGISVLTTFDFYSVNDLHGKIVDGDNQPGVDELTTFFKMAHATDDHPIFLSAGDMWQGSSESNLTYGMLTTDWMNQVGFTAMALGNHEFDWGEEYVQRNSEFAQFPFLAINVYDRQTNKQVDYCKSSVMVDEDGIQIGIIGAIGDCYSSIAPDKVEEVYFKTGSELTALVKAESDRLREDGADFIVYLIHDGHGSSTSSTTVMSSSQLKSYYDVSLSEGYVDLVFEGHSHQKYLGVDQHGVYHLQNRGDNKGGISHVEVEFNTITGSCRVKQSELIPTSVYEKLADDPVVQELLKKYDEQVSLGNQVVGNNGKYRDSDEICQLVAELYYQFGLEQWSDEYDITLGGGFLNTRSPYSLKAGKVVYSQLQMVLPFDNDLVLCSVKGRDLLNRFINTSNDSYFISGDEEQMRSIDPNGIYYIVVDSYTSSYAPNRLTVVKTYGGGYYARDLLADYIRQGSMA
jgi:2',3'-cyclic-nucleotide 2'-phosphodiesterase/3'-nucleotidase